MKDRIYNFAAGPSMLPLEVLQDIQKNLLNYEDTGMSVMEMSHRSSTYLKIFNETKEAIKRVLNVPDNYEILFIQGGASEQFSAIPLNLMKKGKADYICTGVFSSKASKEAKKFGEVNIVWDGKYLDYKKIPSLDELKFSSDTDYVHLCANNTIYGTEWKTFPKTEVPLICDMSSDILSRVINVKDFGMIYAGPQKNMGIAGMAVVIIRKDLIAKASKDIPVLMEYLTQSENDSMYNTPSTFSIYVCGQVVKWVEKMGGLKEMEKRNNLKAKKLYDVLDNSNFYKAHADKDSRSNMNVTFKTPSAELDDKFVKEAKKEGLENLKGHRLVGGIRASIYNAMPLEGVEKLATFMKKFEEDNKGEN